MKNLDESRNYLIEEINKNELMSKKPKKFYRVLKYIEHFLIFISTVTGFVSISAFASLVGISIGITSSAIRLKICVITVGIKRYKSIIKIKKNKHEIILFLAKYKLNIIGLPISKALTDSNTSQDKFVLINNVLKEFCDMNEEIKNSK